ncbi:phosphotransferase family protein [Tenggerimyces flavus]|uniref:Phosphotransferase family protein n=1 Tax=Tenggerimyces flavus TaxID=1708749 RepID=A0ABV7YLL3_9ACTN|nr:phosphotransferase [Tenggerimyces flavus]MBM7784717.1 aminoglycoside phosphotransferase (APT) family kinase protein [Tenggerimyces flavus]
MGDEALRREEVVPFLAGRPGSAEELEPLSGGAWSSAWAYRVGGEELVIRFGPEASWYEADRMAMAFASADLPVPEVREVGTTPAGRAYAISVRHYGTFLEDTPVELAAAVAPALTRLLVALYRVPSSPELPVAWHQTGESPGTWREYLRAGLVDDPKAVVHGWSSALASDKELSTLSSAVSERIHALVDACPERRDLIHGDLLHGNVLVSPVTHRIEAVLSWKCSVRGDFLFDAAWCSFWSSFHPGIAAADPLSGLLGALRNEHSALVDAAARHHCYELHIGYTHLGWNIWTGNVEALAGTARRLAEVLERGPLTLPAAGGRS